MDRRYSLLSWPGWCGEFNSLLFSAACHLTALVAMALVITAGNSSSPQINLAVHTVDTGDTIAADESQLRDAVRVDGDTDDGASLAGPVRMFDPAAFAASDFPSINAPTELAANASGMDGTALANFGDGSGGAGQAGKAATDFFGIEGYGKTFVYVVDCSGSMSENGKFERAVYELLRSIEQLGDDQKYFVIFYNHRDYPMDSPGLVAATEEQFELTRSWVAMARPQGGTVPLPALMKALSMKPDAIFFLSDGLFDPRTGREVRARNRRKEHRIPIHTIAFVNREAEGLMRTIARNSGGKYRFVK